MKQARIVFSGTVQGVGFRFTVQRYAVGLQLKGWVKNCPDGTVEILVEGAEERIEKLCQDVEGHFQGYIRNKKIQFSPPQEALKNFQIIY